MKKTIIVVDQESQIGPVNCDGPLNAIIDSLTQIRNSIPPEYRKSAHCEISPFYDYEGASLRILITYQRPERSREKAARKDMERRKSALVDAQKRETYERLKRRFEPS